MLKGIGVAGAGVTLGSGIVGNAAAAIGDLLAEVELPNHSDGVGIAFDGTYTYTLKGGPFLRGDTLQVYEPPAGNGTATLVAEKDIVDGDGNSVVLSTMDWDSRRGLMWGVAQDVYRLNYSDPTDSSEDVVATSEFTHNGPAFIDGFAYDGEDDSFWVSGDVQQTIYHHAMDGTLLGTVSPRNQDGNNVGVSGVAVGADVNGRPTLYIGKHGPEKILRVYADDGTHINDFAVEVGFRIEDLACDPTTYDSEAIITKSAYEGRYKAYEVEPGTCLIGGLENELEVELDIKPCSDPNAINPNKEGLIPVAIKHTEAFDPNDPESGVDVSTLRFGAPDVVEDEEEGAEPAHNGHVEDVVPCEGDGMDDLVIHFPTEDTGFDGDEDVGRLEGETKDDIPLFGEDSVKIVGGPS